MSADQLAELHATAATAVRPLAKAALGAGTFTEVRNGRIVFALPTEALRKRAEDQRAEIERVLGEQLGRSVQLEIIADEASAPADATPRRTASGAETPPPPAEEDDADIDLADLVDVPKDANLSGLDRIAAAFPGAELMDEDH